MDSVLPWKCESFTHAWLRSYFQWELPGYTQNHKEATTTKIQNKKSCSHLGDQTKAGGFSFSQGFSSYINWMFQVCSAQIAFQANYSKTRKLTLWEDAWLYLHRHTHRLTPTYFCHFSYFFYLCYAMMFSKFVMIRFEAIPVIQLLVSLKSEQKDPEFAFVIVVFPVKIMWKHPALSLTSNIFISTLRNSIIWISFQKAYFYPSLLTIYLRLPNSSIICISDSMSNNTLKCHFMVTSMNDSIYYATLYPCTYPDSKIKYLATPHAVPYFS